MPKIRITKTITQNTHHLVRDPKSPTGWSRRFQVTEATTRRSAEYNLVPCEAPRTVDYYDLDARRGGDFNGGVVGTLVEVDADAEATIMLDAIEIKTILDALVIAKKFTYGMNGEPQSAEQAERALNIRDIARKIGAPRDAILRDIL